MFSKVLQESMGWTATGIASEDLAEGTMREVLLSDEPIMLVRHRGTGLAYQGRCPHEGGVLADGEFREECVVCPLHGATFSIPSGQIVADPDGVRPPSGEVGSLATHPVRVTAGLVEVNLP